ncbi:MAG: hypothetical protein COS11_02230 [bacterium (Candidatus Ratteibacteria) CG01_land_8_20_14_3_00_40_19]|uniref:DUF7718 domain-containing protein n=1 Tax=bacterium (Candidatus Ratteibacteria) CG01_land_8_20_14_3_00_40_19 TaxID=2014290 RepID=A0A2M7E9N3_9BACT|nr:MAG: hypothetical protein COS11_02230 [bacterium (Candidatus Ratteibacteria) CG01_land_8_20_14_3_00_40_19]HCG77413.1 hypothetical protein [bacterium]
MEVKAEQFVFLFSDNVRVRHSHKRIKNHIIEFVIQLEILIKDKWCPVVRYDTIHGFAHKDIIHPSGKVDKIPLPIQNFNEALIFAEEELRAEWEFFKMRYLEEVRQSEGI